jgi:hypothetical protein
MATYTWTAKDPDETVDYTVEYAGKFTYDYITASTWSVSSGSGLTVVSNSFTDHTTTVRLSAGTTGVTYVLLNTITTSKGQIFQVSCSLTCTSLS